MCLVGLGVTRDEHSMLPILRITTGTPRLRGMALACPRKPRQGKPGNGSARDECTGIAARKVLCPRYDGRQAHSTQVIRGGSEPFGKNIEQATADGALPVIGGGMKPFCGVIAPIRNGILRRSCARCSRVLGSFTGFRSLIARGLHGVSHRLGSFLFQVLIFAPVVVRGFLGIFSLSSSCLRNFGARTAIGLGHRRTCETD